MFLFLLMLPILVLFVARQRYARTRAFAESVIEQYRATVRPMFLQFIEPSKQYADIVVPRGGKNRIAINMLKAQRYLLKRVRKL